MPEPQKVLTVTELCDYLRVHRSTIYRLLRSGELPGFRIGSDWRFNVEEIDKWRAGKTIVPPRSRGAVD
jgi:excisionase family DNA binding protein